MFMGKTKFFTPDLTVQKTFKERLSEKADMLTVDINEHMSTVKAKMNEAASYRKFSISLWKSKPGACIAIGNGCTTNYSAFVPYGIEEWVYVRAFRVALEELGFDNIETELTTDNSTYDCYTLKVKW